MDKKIILSKEGVQPAVRELLVQILEAIESGGEVTVTWTDIQGKPSTFPPSAHTHPISDVTSLQTTLDDFNTRITALEGGGGA